LTLRDCAVEFVIEMLKSSSFSRFLAGIYIKKLPCWAKVEDYWEKLIVEWTMKREKQQMGEEFRLRLGVVITDS